MAEQAAPATQAVVVKQPQQKQAPLVPPPFWAPRIEAFEKLQAKYQAEINAKEHKAISIKIGEVKTEGKAFETHPIGALKPMIDQGKLPKELLENSVAVKVNGVVWDLTRVLESDCELEFLTFESPEGKDVFWHSSAHVLGQALEKKYHCLLNVGPPTEMDYWYDAALPEGQQLSANDFGELAKFCTAIAKDKQPFQRIEVTPSEAKELLSFNKYKTALVDKVPEGERITVYRCGPLVDLCRGPHLPNTGYVKAITVTSASSVYLDGSATGDVLQRVHGLAFPSKQQLTDYEALIAEALKRDHKKIGQDQELFFFHPFSPGSAFFLPYGYRVYGTLTDFMKEEYHKRGYSEVLAPNIYMSKLWEISGHWSHYQKNMFTFKCEEQDWALKPMNCPGHCLMFAHRARSYRELPIRFAEFGVLHRNELSGALHGLTRVRRFQQDDSHIFCRADQIESEIEGVIDLIKHTYGTFGFTFRMELSTMPVDHMGDESLWQKAEAQLEDSIRKSGMPWKLNKGDGAFYGPKIDIHIQDALKRFHQCATIQLDFQLPIKFELKYMSADGAKLETPVMIHRAVFGSIERFLAVLIEHTAGKWPFWLSPRQVIVLPVSEKFIGYAQTVAKQLHDAHFYVDVDDSDRKIQKKIREAQLAQYNYIIVVGAEEEQENCVNVRLRDGNDVIGKMSVAELITRLKQLVVEHK